jgi:hypothetical protein
MKKRIHPLAEIFPELEATAFENLKGSIDEHGQRDPIVLLGDEILDGRNRYKACLELGRNPQFRNFDPARDGDPIKFVADKNLNRRHLTPGQRASVAKKIDDFLKKAEEEAKANPPEPTPEPPKEDKTGATIEPDEDEKPGFVDPVKPNPTADKPDDKPADDRAFRQREKEAADKAGASPRALRDFKFVEKYSPADAKLVTKGTITLNEGVKRAKAKKDKTSKFRNEAADHLASNHDEAFADKVREGEVLRKDGDLRAFNRLELKEQRRIKKLVEEGLTTPAALKLKNGDFSEKDTVATLVEWFKAQDEEDLDEAGWATVEIGGHVFAIGKKSETDQEADN